MLKKITLIRHAESVMNLKSEFIIGGRSLHTPLTEKGKIQSKELGEYFKAKNIKFDKIYCSSAIRTQETLKHCFQSSDFILDENLLEIDQGDWEGVSREIYKRSDVKYQLDNNNWEFIPGDTIKGESQKWLLREWKNVYIKLFWKIHLQII